MKNFSLNPKKLNKDINPVEYPNEFYFDAWDVKIISKNSNKSLSFSNRKGNKHVADVPEIENAGGSFKTILNGSVFETLPYTLGELFDLPSTSNHKIIKFGSIGNRLFVFTKDGDYGAIWELKDRLHLIYYNRFNFSNDHPIRKVIGLKESEDVQKLYFTDYYNYLRHYNVEQGLNVPIRNIEAFPYVKFNKPTIDNVYSGGLFKPGYIQYAYNLYTLNGAETKISPFSDLAPISLNYKGAEPDEMVSKSFEVSINNISQDFKYINVYRLHYTSQTALPKVSLILEEEIKSETFTFVDDNNFDESASSLETISFIGTDPFICKDIEPKDNILFPISPEYDRFDTDFDARAYSFNKWNTFKIFDNTQGQITSSNFNIPKDHDCINPSVKAEVGDVDYSTYKYLRDGTTLGAEGPNVKLEIVNKSFNPSDSNDETVQLNSECYAGLNHKNYLSLKRDETYRFFIRFRNTKGQASFIKWIADLRMPNQDTHPISNEVGGKVYLNVLGIKATVKNTEYDWEILRAKRDERDKTILCQGILNSTLQSPESIEDTGGPTYARGLLQTNPITTTHHNNSRLIEYGDTFSDNSDYSIVNSKTSDKWNMFTHILQMYSPDIEHRNQFNFTKNNYLNVVGGLENFYNVTYSYVLGDNGTSYKEEGELGSLNKLYSSGYNTFPNSGMLSLLLYDNGGILNNQNGNVIYDIKTNYRSIIRKGGSMLSNGISKKSIFGDTYLTQEGDNPENPIKHDYNNSLGNTSFFNTSWVGSRMSGRKIPKHKAKGNKCLTFNIGFFNSSDILENYLSEIPKTDIGKFVVADLKKEVFNQYGGNTFEARSKNNPIVVSDLVSKETSTTFYNGDTFVNFWSTLTKSAFTIKTEDIDQRHQSTIKENLILPIESDVPQDLRYDTENLKRQGHSKLNSEFDDFKKPLDVYNQNKKYQTGIPKPFKFTPIEKFKNRVLASNVKIYNEAKDSWLQIKENSYLDLSGSYGDLTGIYEDRDQLFVFQPSAVAMIAIRPRVQVSDTSGTEIEIGKGAKLHDFQYLTTSAGSVNQFGVFKSSYGLYFVDALNKNLSLLNKNVQPISDSKGLHSTFQNLNYNDIKTDNPLKNKGVVGYYDFDNKELYIAILQTKNTLVPGIGNSSTFEDDSFLITYDNYLDGVHTFKKPTSFSYYNNLQSIYSANSNRNAVYLENEGLYGHYYGDTYEMSITFIVNPDYINNVYDSIVYNSIVELGDNKIPTETISKIRVYNDYQDTGFVNVKGTKKYNKWKVDIPRQQNTRNRIMSNYCYLTLVFDNNNNKEISIQPININYRNKPTSFI